ncbi:methyltransferase [Streptomonospora halophila]|uniref:Methyltransferase n=1 Tax=Streptomonospora halophila TaxID=427369 RepID=A0ABP9GLP4_9ACTN
MSAPDRAEAAARAAAVRTIYGYMSSQIIRTAEELRIPDLVRDRPLDVGEIADATGAHARSLHRLLRALVTLEVLTEPEAGLFGPGPRGGFLADGGEHSLRSITRLFTGAEFADSWRELRHSVMTGRAAFDRVHGTSFYEYLGAESEFARLFGEAMAENARFEAPRIVAAHDFGRYSSIVDVGGGDGSLLTAVLAANVETAGTLLETPEAAEQARVLVEKRGLSGRCEVVEGDFFARVPPGAQAYLLKSVVHNWNDDACVRILRTCRHAMRSDGRLLLIEPVLSERTDPDADMALESALSDVNMLVLTAGGVERTRAEFEGVLGASGFRLDGISPRIEGTDFRVIEALPL